MLTTGDRIVLKGRPITGTGVVLYRSPADPRRVVVRLDDGAVRSPFEHDLLPEAAAEQGAQSGAI